MTKRIQVITMVAVLATAMTGQAASLMTEDYETGQTVGAQPTGATNVRPLVGNTNTAFTLIVTGSTNTASSGNAVQLYDNDPTTYPALEYNFVASSNEQESTVRAEFKFSWKGGTVSNDYYLNIGLGAYNDDLTMNAKTNRWNEMRLYENGELSFDAGSTKIDISPADSAHTVILFANDLPDPINYEHPAGTTNYLAGDSIACWLDGELKAVPLLDIGDYDIGNSTNNIGKIGFSSGTSATGVSYVIDDIDVSVFDVIPYVPPDVEENILYVDFEGDIVGNQTGTTPTALQRPFINVADNFIKVVGPSENLAGTGKGIQLHDNAIGDAVSALEYNFAAGGSVDHVSAVLVDFNFAWVTTNASPSTKPLHFGLGEYDSIRTFFTSAKRFTDVRFYADGTIDFRRNAPPSLPTNDYRVLHMAIYPDSQNNQLTPGSHNLRMFVNDYNTDFVDYTGPDDNVYSLPTNCVAYWLDGQLVKMTNDTETNDYIVMDLFDSTPGYLATIMTTEDNLGKIGFNSETAATNVNWVFDDFLVSTNLLYLVDTWEKWLAEYPTLGTSTNYLDDFEPDGLDNLTECALGGDPTVDDAASVLPTYFTNVENATNFLNYVYNRRVYRAGIGLEYDVESSTTLSVPRTAATEEAGVGPAVDEMESVTNRVSCDTLNNQFMQLHIEKTNP